jgi:hypothetical protein
MESVSELIEPLGGTSAVAAALALPVTTVSSWKVRDQLPSRYWAPIINLARERRIAGISLERLVELHSPKRRRRRRAA